MWPITSMAKSDMHNDVDMGVADTTGGAKGAAACASKISKITDAT